MDKTTGSPKILTAAAVFGQFLALLPFAAAFSACLLRGVRRVDGILRGGLFLRKARARAGIERKALAEGSARGNVYFEIGGAGALGGVYRGDHDRENKQHGALLCTPGRNYRVFRRARQRGQGLYR